MPSKIESPRKANGRPTKKTDLIVESLMKAIETGAPYSICCASVGLAYDTFMKWKREDVEFASKIEAIAAKAALRLLGKIEKHAQDNFAAASWILERRFLQDFSRPEVQLNLIQQNNTTVNALSITIAREEIRDIEAVAEPVRASVRQMFDRYKPNHGNGNGHSAGSQVLSEDNGPKDAQPVIARQAGDENSSAFWNLFASGDAERGVEKSIAIFVTKSIVDEAIGRGRGNQAVVVFKNDPTTIGEVLSAIDRLCGGTPAGWQLLQKKANYSASP